MGEKSAHISLRFWFVFVCVCASRRAVPRERPGIQGDVRPGGVCELLQSFHLQMGPRFWFGPVLCCQRQPSEPAQQCAWPHILHSADGPGTVSDQKGSNVPGLRLLGVCGRLTLPRIYSRLCSGGFLPGLRVNVHRQLCVALHQPDT